MTRIAGVPPELRALSRAFSDAAPELQKTSAQLAGVALPEMPPGVAGQIGATLSGVGSRLQSAALTVERAGIDADHSATWLEIAGRSGLLVTLGRPWSSPFDPFRMPTTESYDVPLLDLPNEGYTPGGLDLPDEGFTPGGLDLPNEGFTPSLGGGGLEIFPVSPPFSGIVNSENGEEKPPIVIVIPPGRWPDADETIRQGEEDGNPAIGAVDRDGAAQRRRERLRGVSPVDGKDRDEWPPAVIKPDGDGSTVRPADPHDNRGMGSHIGGRLRGVPDGSRVHIKLGEEAL